MPFFLLVALVSQSQTATNFICNDCDGNSINLFNKLDSGKVVVLCWVMPCSSCIPATKATYNIVETYQTSHPGRVMFYLCDDYANTSCSSINSWANSNSIPSSIFSKRFSNSSIDMTHYGTTGMPKIVIVAGNEHKVMYNANNTVNISDIQAAINQGLIANDIAESEKEDSFINVQTNNNQQTLDITFNFKQKSFFNLEVINIAGQFMFNQKINYQSGINVYKIDISKLINSFYLVRIYNADFSKTFKFIK